MSNGRNVDSVFGLAISRKYPRLNLISRRMDISVYLAYLAIQNEIRNLG